MNNVRFKKFHALAMAPEFANETDSGADLRWYEDMTGVLLNPGETRRFWTGIGVRLPAHTELQIRPRSSMSAKGLLCHFGTCDESYVGQLGIVITNLGREAVVISRGDKIAQAVIVSRLPGVTFDEVEDLGETVRGERGWGSSGKQ